jgi:hypothetical protein
LVEQKKEGDDEAIRDKNFLVLLYIHAKQLFTNKLYLSLSFCYIFGNCVIIIMGSIVNIICTNFGYASIYGSIIALFVIGLGMISVTLYSIFLIKRPDQSKIQTYFFFCAITCLVIAEVCIVFGYFIPFMIFASVLGIFGMPILSIVFEQCTYKFPGIPLIIINSLLNTTGQLFAAAVQMYLT